MRPRSRRIGGLIVWSFEGGASGLTLPGDDSSSTHLRYRAQPTELMKCCCTNSCSPCHR